MSKRAIDFAAVKCGATWRCIAYRRIPGTCHGCRHESHIGWTAEKGFDLTNIPPEWQELFDKAGVTKDQLQDAETQQFGMA
jgi:hypothetical protein